MLQSAKSLTFSLFMGLISHFFCSLFPLPGMHMCMHTHSHVLFLSGSFCWWPSVHVWRTKHSKNDTVTSYTITFISLFRKKKIPWQALARGLSCVWTLYQWSLMKGIHITESNRAFGESWDWCQRGNVVECVCSRLLWKKKDSLKSF